MEFRLVLRGHLPPAKRGTVDVKHRIRRELHPQLKTLWQQHPMLKTAWTGGKSLRVEELAEQYSRCGFRFVPLVRGDDELACSLDILLLRRDEPHMVFGGHGDLDGRVKTLIDGLQIPQQCSEVAGQAPGDDENPMFCLLENDKLIFDFAVRTDRLLLPPDPDEAVRDVFAVIQVRVKTTSGGDPFAQQVYWG